MNKKFIPHEEALAFEELGFDEPCFAKYEKDGLFQLFHTIEIAAYLTINSNGVNGIVCAPLYQQAFRWFRERHNLFGVVDIKHTIMFYKIEDINEKLIAFDAPPFKSHEEAELECLKQLIKIVTKEWLKK